MKHSILYLIILLTVSTAISNGQTPVNDTTGVLGKLFHRLATKYEDSDRIRINDSISTIIDSYVRSDTIFNHSFKNLRYLGQITSSDSLLKIVTWNLVLGSGHSRYFCYLVKKQENSTENRIYRLSTGYNENEVRTDTTYDIQHWYGALYYDIKPYVIDNSKFWVLLGIDYGNPFITRKIIDVLSFGSDDSLIFGNKWFDDGKEKKFRDILEYASNAMMSLKFESDSSIVFDHLVPLAPDLKDDRQYYAPDYSSDGYFLTNGTWKLKINIDARNRNPAPNRHKVIRVSPY